MNKKTFTFLLLLVAVAISETALANEYNKTTFLWGTWVFDKAVQVGGWKNKNFHLENGDAQKLILNKNSINCPEDTCFLVKGKYEKVKFSIKTKLYVMTPQNTIDSSENLEKGTMVYYAGVKEAFGDRTVIVTCGFKDGTETAFEVTSSGELAFYCDGQFVFFKKISGKGDGNAKK